MLISLWQAVGGEVVSTCELTQLFESYGHIIWCGRYMYLVVCLDDEHKQHDAQHRKASGSYLCSVTTCIQHQECVRI